MTNEEILTKAIEQAVRNGWDTDSQAEYFGRSTWDLEGNLVKADYNIIFSHDFAKAFWDPAKVFITPDGTRLEIYRFCHVKCGTPINIEINNVCSTCEDEVFYTSGLMLMRNYHLREMVVLKDPIKYLERFLDE